MNVLCRGLPIVSLLLPRPLSTSIAILFTILLATLATAPVLLFTKSLSYRLVDLLCCRLLPLGIALSPLVLRVIPKRSAVRCTSPQSYKRNAN